MSFHPHHVFQFPSPPPAPKSHNSTFLHMSPLLSAAFVEDAGHCYQFDITVFGFVFIWMMLVGCFFFASDHSAKVSPLLFLCGFTFHICFIFSYSLHDVKILTYMTTGVMGRNVLRLKKTCIRLKILKKFSCFVTFANNRRKIMWKNPHEIFNFSPIIANFFVLLTLAWCMIGCEPDIFCHFSHTSFIVMF